MQALAEEKLAARTPGERIDALMSVSRSESGEEEFAFVCAVVAVRVGQENEGTSVAERSGAGGATDVPLFWALAATTRVRVARRVVIVFIGPSIAGSGFLLRSVR
jgi:hypothetical protein